MNNPTKLIQNGTTLIAKQRCTIKNQNIDALIIGKEYIAKNVTEIDFTIVSEISENHYFSLTKNEMIGYWEDFFDIKQQSTTTNIDFTPSFMKETTPERKGIHIGLGLAVIGLILFIAFFKFSCNTPSKPDTKQQYIDSLNIIRAIEKKQAGKEISILMNEVTELQKEKLALKQEKDSIKQHEKQLIATNTFLIKKMRETAPKECQAYIDSCDEYHRQIELSKDAAYYKQAEELCKSEQSNQNLMKIIGIKDMETAKDSANHAKNMQLKDENIANLTKQTKRAKFWGKLAVGAAVVYTGVVMLLTVVK